jgi:hypothetical protein
VLHHPAISASFIWSFLVFCEDTKLNTFGPQPSIQYPKIHIDSILLCELNADFSGLAVWGMNRFRPLEHWDHGFESHSRHGCLCVCLFCVSAVLCAGSRLATGWSPVQGVLPNVYRIKKLKNKPRSKRLWSHRESVSWRFVFGHFGFSEQISAIFSTRRALKLLVSIRKAQGSNLGLGTRYI